MSLVLGDDSLDLLVAEGARGVDRDRLFPVSREVTGRNADNSVCIDLEGDVDVSKADEVADRLCGLVFHIALQLVSEDVGSIDDVDIGANPCYISTDNTGRFLLGAYYSDGMATVLVFFLVGFYLLLSVREPSTPAAPPSA